MLGQRTPCPRGTDLPSRILVSTSRFFLYSRAVAQLGWEGMAQLGLLPGKGCTPESWRG